MINRNYLGKKCFKIPINFNLIIPLLAVHLKEIPYNASSSIYKHIYSRVYSFHLFIKHKLTEDEKCGTVVICIRDTAVNKTENLSSWNSILVAGGPDMHAYICTYIHTHTWDVMLDGNKYYREK